MNLKNTIHVYIEIKVDICDLRKIVTESEHEISINLSFIREIQAWPGHQEIPIIKLNI